MLVQESFGMTFIIKILNLSGNQLTGDSVLNKRFGFFPNLYSLNLSNNHIVELEDNFLSIYGTARLLDLSFNRIRRFPKIVTKMMRLQKLRLSGNLFSSVPQDIAALFNKKVKLYLEWNTYTRFDMDIKEKSFSKKDEIIDLEVFEIIASDSQYKCVSEITFISYFKATTGKDLPKERKAILKSIYYRAMKS